MAVEKTLKINSMLTEPSLDGLSNVVVSVTWSRIVKETVGEGEDAKTYSCAYAGVLVCPPPSSDNFVPYENLTEEEVKSWIAQEVDLDPIDAGLEEQLQKDIDGPKNLNLPW